MVNKSNRQFLYKFIKNVETSNLISNVISFDENLIAY